MVAAGSSSISDGAGSACVDVGTAAGTGDAAAVADLFPVAVECGATVAVVVADCEALDCLFFRGCCTAAAVGGGGATTTAAAAATNVDSVGANVGSAGAGSAAAATAAPAAAAAASAAAAAGAATAAGCAALEFLFFGGGSTRSAANSSGGSAKYAARACLKTAGDIVVGAVRSSKIICKRGPTYANIILCILY